eukprot:TRINITY_DN44283_c0_g1_i1.p1 TRINITY_DN44283_c0_g1~~TRINITY_DN44283_c0_g1_i1.p1  ORF type:complete len:168 (+),score=36.24 TRINITY_DN44283_c0_g1_i1:63-506(+)
MIDGAAMMGGMMPMGCFQGMTPMSMAAGSPAFASGATLNALPDGPEVVMRALQDLPSDMAADPRGFMLRCALPGVLAQALASGGTDSAMEEVQRFTAARIRLGGNPSEATRIVTIEGPLLNVCAAYLLLMVRYCEAEREQVPNSLGS